MVCVAVFLAPYPCIFPSVKCAHVHAEMQEPVSNTLEQFFGGDKRCRARASICEAGWLVASTAAAGRSSRGSGGSAPGAPQRFTRSAPHETQKAHDFHHILHAQKPRAAACHMWEHGAGRCGGLPRASGWACDHARAAAWCTAAGGSTMQPHNSHCSSICYVVESPCWARVWVRMRVQQGLHLVPAAGGYLPRSLLRSRSSCSIPRQSLAYQTLTQRAPCISVHYDACLDRSSRGVAVWQASACGCRGHAAGSVAAIRILGPARGSAGVVGGAGKLCT